jgi:tRNA1Val (adenine37-N6)-methyltransferase
VSSVTIDRFLGGRVTVRQPTLGFRAGLDTVMLAAAVPAKTGDAVLELGAGSGTASLCLAARVPGCTISGVEIDPALVALARENATENRLQERVSFIEGDALGPGLRGEFDHVLANPPFHRNDGEVSAHEGRARAKHDKGGLAAWIAAGFKRVRSRGVLTVIIRADRLREVLVAMPETGVVLFPLWPRIDAPAKRVIVQLRKGSSVPFEILPGLALHEGDGEYTREADAVLRGRRSTALTEL